ncbi:GDP-mannose 4,6-dehydratase [Pseudomonas indica]|uniref:GDP-mannose 4,6-dehydratase n=1 Tax=Pseudomonas indica TaxID=137658 RepID=UPI003FD535A8
MRLLVTGLGGFVGQAFVRRYEARALAGHELCLTARHDLLDISALQTMVADTRPDAVIHLAGQTFVPEAFRDPARTFQINVLGTLNLLQALKRSAFSGSFLYVSSGDIYGQVPEHRLPIHEAMLPHPRNPYGVSKLSAELLCQQWGYTEGWRVLVARPFNHIGVGQKDSFVIASAARQIARIRKGMQAPRLEVGDIDVTRDFLDVDDVIDAYLAILTKGWAGDVYNVCSGRERRIRDLIGMLADIAGVDLELVQDPARLRRAEQRRVQGSFDRLRAATGWEPKITIERSLQAVLADWELRVLQE